jgi:chaperone required for assembly of F1-ATPase
VSEAAKRFYTQARACSALEGFVVKLDERPLRTPNGGVFGVASRALAEAIAGEWEAQAERIIPAAMPLTQLAFAALDHTPARRAELVAHVARYCETDLCRHRAAAPAGLVARQSAAWDPIVAWAEEAFEINLPVVTGIAVARADIAPLIAYIEALDDFRLTLLAHAAELAGSALIALALAHGRLGGEAAFAAAMLDDLWNLERWGEDAQARANLDRLRAELDAAARFVAALDRP